MTYTEYWRHTNDTDTLIAVPIIDGAWSGAGAITGDNTDQSTRYKFAGLVNDRNYEIYIRAGVSLVESDEVIATIVPPSATQSSVDALLNSGPQTTAERSSSDAKSLTLQWPVSGATITGTVSLDNAAYGAVAGAITFLRTENGKHYYSLAYAAADRPTAEGTARYLLVDGTYTKTFTLRVVAPPLSSVQTQSAAGAAITSAELATSSQIVSLGSRIPAALVGGRMDASTEAIATDVVTEIQSGLASQASVDTLIDRTGSQATVERSLSDTKPITFQWPTSEATIASTVSIDNSDYIDTSGAISFLRTENNKYYYTLAYNSADRPTSEGTARYSMTDGTFTKIFALRVSSISLNSAETQSAAAAAITSAGLNDQLNNIPTVEEFEARTLPSGEYFNPDEDTVSRVTLVDTTTDITNLDLSDLATSGQVNSLNNISLPDVLDQVSSGLAIYDGPTMAELEARTLPSGEYGIVNVIKEDAVRDIFEGYTLQEQYAASGTEGTPAQILYFIQQVFSEFAISGVTIDVKKLDGTTTAAQFVIDDENNPSSRARTV